MLIVTYEHGLISKSFGGGQRILIELLTEFLKNSDVILITQGHKDDKLPLQLCDIRNLKIKYVKRSENAVLSGIRVFLAAVPEIFKYTDVRVISFTSELFWISSLRVFKKFTISAYLAAPDLNGFEQKSVVSRLKILRKRLELYLFLKGFKRSNKKVAIGNQIRTQAQSILKINDIKTIFPGVRDLKLKNRYGLQSKHLSFIYIGRLELNQKPLTEFLDCLSTADFNWKMVHIIGDGPDYNYLRNKYKSNKFLFHGSLPIDAISHIIDDCDLAVLPSKNESFMLTAYEMVKMGLPVVCNDVADLSSNLGHLSTVSIIPNKKSEYLNLFKKIDKKRYTSKECLTSARYVSKNFSWAKLAQTLKD